MYRGKENVINDLPEKLTVLPNVVPWNKLLLDGKLELNYGHNNGEAGVKTRSYFWPTDKEQPFYGFVLLYNSSRQETQIMRRHGIMEAQPKKAAVGLGYLGDVRLLKPAEQDEWILRAHNIPVTRENMRSARQGLIPREEGVYDDFNAYPGDVGLVFSALWKFENPVEVNWPAGPVQSLRIKTEDIRGQLLKASIVRTR